MSTFNFKYSSVIESENKIYDDVRTFLVEQNVNPQLIKNILLAVSESFTNALLYGNQSDQNKFIHLSMTTNNNEIIADVTDEGPGDVNTLWCPDKVDLWQEGGRGMMLIKKMTSDVKFRKSSKTGGVQVLMKFDAHKYSHKVGYKIL